MSSTRDWPRRAGASTPLIDDVVEATRLGVAAETDVVVVGITGAHQHAAVAVCVNGELRAFCEQERITRVRRAGLKARLLPVEALDTALRCAGAPVTIRTYVTAETDVRLPDGLPVVRVDHHQAHAAAAFYLSGYDAAGVLVCDRSDRDQTSVWLGTADGISRVPWPDGPQGFAALYSTASKLFGFPLGHNHELEGLARLDTGEDAHRFHEVIKYDNGAVVAAPGWEDAITEWLAEGRPTDHRRRARVASAFQHHLGALLLRLAADIRARTSLTRICLGGGLFYNTYFTTLISQSMIFDDVAITPNPGNAGVAIGAALDQAKREGSSVPMAVSPFLGPAFYAEDIKRTLDNCKLSYEHLDERQVVDTTVDALARGQLVGWFQGRMEWGHRALGNRSILASPRSPYVLDNLNVFLKHRPRHLTYGVSIREEDLERFFVGPRSSRYMEYEYRPTDLELFKSMMPEDVQTIRVQTIPKEPADDSSRRFRRLHEKFGEATGLPVLINTSFNGFAEPMVCSPRDAIRVFFGTGLDLLVLDRFVLRK